MQARGEGPRAPPGAYDRGRKNHDLAEREPCGTTGEAGADCFRLELSESPPRRNRGDPNRRQPLRSWPLPLRGSGRPATCLLGQPRSVVGREKGYPMDSFSYRTVQETARLTRQRIAEAGTGAPVVLLHGFPEEARTRGAIKLPALAECRVSRDRTRSAWLRRHGPTFGTIRNAYDHVELAADVVALLDALDIERAPLVAHDWGAALAWNAALLHPDRVTAVVALSVAFGGRSLARPLATLEARFGGAFFYMLYFQKPGVAEAELEADVRESLRVFYYSSSGDVPPGSFFVPQPNTAKLFRLVEGAARGLPRWLTEGRPRRCTPQPSENPDSLSPLELVSHARSHVGANGAPCRRQSRAALALHRG